MAHVHHRGPGVVSDESVVVGRLPRTLLVVILVVVAVLTVVGLVLLWPDSDAAEDLGDRAQFAAPGVTFPRGVVTDVHPACPTPQAPEPGDQLPDMATKRPDESCGRVAVEVTEGEDAGRALEVQVPPEVSRSGLGDGDEVQLMRIPGAGRRGGAAYSYWATERAPALGLLAAGFALLVLVVARLRGLMAIVGLGLSALVIYKFMLPALLTGEPATWVALSGATAILFVVLYTTHGVSLRTSAALAGTVAGVGLTALIGWYAVGATRLTGVSDEAGGILTSIVGQVDFQDLLMCGVIIAGLGVLNDVTITQASAVWELRAAAPGRSRRAVFSGAMRIGRDHIASTIYTIVFVYMGSAILVLLLLYLHDQPLLDVISSEELAEEVARTVASGMALVAAVPLTTAIAALVASPRPADAPAVIQTAAARGMGTDDVTPNSFDEFWDRR